jgi:hypothetical protein
VRTQQPADINIQSITPVKSATMQIHDASTCNRPFVSIVL